MKKRTPVQAYRLLSSPSNKPTVFISSRGSPCTKPGSPPQFKLGNLVASQNSEYLPPPLYVTWDLGLRQEELKKGDECGFPSGKPCVWFFLVKQINWSNIILEIKIGLTKCWGPNNFRVKIYFIDASFQHLRHFFYQYNSSMSGGWTVIIWSNSNKI